MLLKITLVLMGLWSLDAFSAEFPMNNQERTVLSGQVRLMVGETLLDIATGTIVGATGSNQGIAILTSAHIFDTIPFNSVKTIFVFENSNSISIVRWILHPAYKKNGSRCDLALGFLSQFVNLPYSFDWSFEMELSPSLTLNCFSWGLQFALNNESFGISISSKATEKKVSSFSFDTATGLMSSQFSFNCVVTTLGTIQMTNQEVASQEFLKVNLDDGLPKIDDDSTGPAHQGDSGSLWWKMGSTGIRPIGLTSKVEMSPSVATDMTAIMHAQRFGVIDISVLHFTMAHIHELGHFFYGNNILTSLWSHGSWIESQLKFMSI